MNLNFKHIALLFVLLASLPMASYAQITTKKVSFPKGQSGTTIAGTIKGYQTIDYTVALSKGQTFKVSLSTKHTACYFNILEPGSNDVAIFNSSMDGNNHSSTLNMSGTYKIRVYLMRSAARRGETASFSLKISANGGKSASTDAKVPGTNYNATGDLRAAIGSTQKSAKFGVIRSNNRAEVHATIPGKPKRIFVFANEKWTCNSGSCKLTFAKIGFDEWELICNGTEKYYIPDAVIYGG